MTRFPVLVALAFAVFLAAPLSTQAVDVQGTLTLEGQAIFDSGIPGVDLDDIRIRVDLSTAATGNGVRCSILSATHDEADAGGLYPEVGVVTAEVLMERGGPQQPEGGCVVTVRASGWDGTSVTAHGIASTLATAAQIGTNATLAMPALLLRQSKAAAGLSRECKAWSKSRLTLRDKCNAKILQLGGLLALAKCKEPLKPEPPDCDPGDQVDAVLELSHGPNDQQTDVSTGEAVDTQVLAGQLKCQKLLGKAGRKFFAALAARIQTECVKTGDDSLVCREQQVNAIRRKLDPIDACAADAAADGTTGRVVPAVGGLCSDCITGPDVDARCLKDCFELNVAGLAWGLVGDVPECGDGILQNGEFCDDGNLDDGDCCSALCGIESPGSQTCGVGACAVTVAECAEGEVVLCEPAEPAVMTEAGPDCTNGVDDDCDGVADAMDPDCP